MLAYRQRQHVAQRSATALVVLVVVANAAVALTLATGILPLGGGEPPAPAPVVREAPPTPRSTPPAAPRVPPAPVARPAPAPPLRTVTEQVTPEEPPAPAQVARTVAFVAQIPRVVTATPLPPPPPARPPAPAPPPAPAAPQPQPPEPAPEPQPAPEPDPTPVVEEPPPPVDTEIVLKADGGMDTHELTFRVPVAGEYEFAADILVFTAGEELSVSLDGQGEQVWISDTDGPDWVVAELWPVTELEEGEHTLRISGTSDDGARLKRVVVSGAGP